MGKYILELNIEEEEEQVIEDKFGGKEAFEKRILELITIELTPPKVKLKKKGKKKKGSDDDEEESEEEE